MNGKFVSRKNIYVALAEPKEERREMLQSHLFQPHNLIGRAPTIPTSAFIYNIGSLRLNHPIGMKPHVTLHHSFILIIYLIILL